MIGFFISWNAAAEDYHCVDSCKLHMETLSRRVQWDCFPFKKLARLHSFLTSNSVS